MVRVDRLLQFSLATVGTAEATTATAPACYVFVFANSLLFICICYFMSSCQRPMTHCLHNIYSSPITAVPVAIGDPHHHQEEDKAEEDEA